IRNQHGFSLYTITDNNVLFMTEFGENDKQRSMHVNFYVRYSTYDRDKIIGEENFIKFVSSVAYFFQINNVVIWAEHRTCEKDIKQLGGKKRQRFFSVDNYRTRILDDTVQPDLDGFIFKRMYGADYLGGNFCFDFFIYFKDNIKKYFDKEEIQPAFSYHQLDKLKRISPLEILRKDDQDELYQIYETTYDKNKNNDNIADFYVWIIN